MAELDLEKEMTKIEKFLVKNNRRDFVDEMRSATRESLDFKMLRLAVHREEIASAKVKDEELQKVTDHKKELEAVYKEQLKMNAKMARFIGLLMSEKGFSE